VTGADLSGPEQLLCGMAHGMQMHRSMRSSMTFSRCAFWVGDTWGTAWHPAPTATSMPAALSSTRYKGMQGMFLHTDPTSFAVERWWLL